MPTKVLVTGFEPFDTFDRNISQDVVQELAQSDSNYFSVEGIELFTRVLSVTYGRSETELTDAILEIQPDYVVLLGLSVRDETFSIENVAMNIDSASICDNDKELRDGCKIDLDGPVGYWSDLPVDRIVEKLQVNNIPVRKSYHAGNFICNHLFYYAKAFASTSPVNYKAGFIHLTPLRSDIARWGLGDKGAEMSDVRKGIREILICIANDSCNKNPST